jgi:hypothetical protein
LLASKTQENERHDPPEIREFFCLTHLRENRLGAMLKQSKRRIMDVFWLIPIGIVAIALLCLFLAYLLMQPSTHSPPNVLVDKPGEPSIDHTTQNRDWSGRPCGSVLDWLTGHHQ